MAADFSLWNISVFYYRFPLQALTLLYKVSGAFGVCGQLEPELAYFVRWLVVDEACF